MGAAEGRAFNIGIMEKNQEQLPWTVTKKNQQTRWADATSVYVLSDGS